MTFAVTGHRAPRRRRQAAGLLAERRPSLSLRGDRVGRGRRLRGGGHGPDLAIFAPWIAPQDPLQGTIDQAPVAHRDRGLSPSAPTNWGRDMLRRAHLRRAALAVHGVWTPVMIASSSRNQSHSGGLCGRLASIRSRCGVLDVFYASLRCCWPSPSRARWVRHPERPACRSRVVFIRPSRGWPTGDHSVRSSNMSGRQGSGAIALTHRSACMCWDVPGPNLRLCHPPDLGLDDPRGGGPVSFSGSRRPPKCRNGD